MAARSPSAFAVALVALLALALPARSDTPRSAAAVGAYRNLVGGFARGPLLRADATADAIAAAWPASQALAATLAVAEAAPSVRGDAARAVARLAPYWSPQQAAFESRELPPLGNGGSTFVDDNEWLALDLVRAYRVLARRAPLDRARTVYHRLVADAWDDDRTHPCPGGVFWSVDPAIRDRNTVSTANAALLALELWRETGDADYVSDARRFLDWLDRCELRADGLYGDHIAIDGTRNDREWSYNQGAVVAARALLYEATGDTTSLRRAQRLADRSLARFGAGFAGEPAEFVAIFLDDLRTLDRVDGGNRFRPAAEAYLARADWSPPTLLTQAARVRILGELAALG
jgi:uncharacterized protein YyaL (SSP411 family)